MSTQRMMLGLYGGDSIAHRGKIPLPC